MKRDKHEMHNKFSGEFIKFKKDDDNEEKKRSRELSLNAIAQHNYLRGDFSFAQ